MGWPVWGPDSPQSPQCGTSSALRPRAGTGAWDWRHPRSPERLQLTLCMVGHLLHCRHCGSRQCPQHESQGRGSRGQRGGGQGSSPPTPGQSSCCSGIAALRHPDLLGCPPPSAPSKPSRVSTAHGLQTGSGGRGAPGPAQSGASALPGPAGTARGGERSIRRGKHAGGLSLLPAPPQRGRA